MRPRRPVVACSTRWQSVNWRSSVWLLYDILLWIMSTSDLWVRWCHMPVWRICCSWHVLFQSASGTSLSNLHVIFVLPNFFNLVAYRMAVSSANRSTSTPLPQFSSVSTRATIIIWSVAVGIKQRIRQVGVGSRNTSTRYVWRASASTDHSHCRFSDREQASPDWQSSRQSAFSSREASSWCWRRIVSHHKTYLLSGFGRCLLDNIQDVVSPSTETDPFDVEAVTAVGRHAPIIVLILLQH